MTIRRPSTKTLVILRGTLLVLATAAVVHAQVPRPSPPYLQVNAQLISPGVTFAEAALRRVLPADVRPVPGLTGGINVYQAPAGYGLAPYSAVYLWVDIEGHDSPDGAKGRWMLQGVYGPAPVAAALREHFGWPVRTGGSRWETTERGTRGVGLLGDREVISVEIKPSAEPCQPIHGSVNYLSQLGAPKKLVVNEIPYVGELCGAEAIAVAVQAPDGDPIEALTPAGVLWAREIKGFAFSFGRPKPIE
jgi:hypothetical protein